MIFHGDLPPVGSKISLQRSADNPLDVFFDENKYWLDSGTSCLALALLDIRAKLPQVVRPRAIIPGYCCPDLVAACVYAGVEPVAVDINVSDPAYDLEQLGIHLDERVVAVIAINFLGITERIGELKKLIVSLGSHARIIEDNAQWFPSLMEKKVFIADYATFSFGRGKPVSLLGGGLLLTRDPVSESVLDSVEASPAKSRLLSFKIRAYNLLLSPRFYMLLNRNPFMDLGSTRYTPLTKIARLDGYRRSLLASNLIVYSRRENKMYFQYHEAATKSGLQRLDSSCTSRIGRLLRYPLLCADVATKSKLLAAMARSGLGATAMYAVAIDEVEGVGNLVVVPSVLKNAKSFASRFMTLPIGADIAAIFSDRILQLLRNR